MSFHGVVIYDNTLYVRCVYIHNEIAYKRSVIVYHLQIYCQRILTVQIERLQYKSSLLASERRK